MCTVGFAFIGLFGKFMTNELVKLLTKKNQLSMLDVLSLVSVIVIMYLTHEILPYLCMFSVHLTISQG